MRKIGLGAEKNYSKMKKMPSRRLAIPATPLGTPTVQSALMPSGHLAIPTALNGTAEVICLIGIVPGCYR